MDKSVFTSRFSSAAARAREFAQTLVKESLPQQMLFHLFLNNSCDVGASDEFKLFPEDSFRTVHLQRLTAQQVVDELWRNGLVPQWVDLSVIGETGVSTLVGVLACGRFTSDEKRLYRPLNEEYGYAPFQVKSPVLPVGYVDGQPFSIYNRCTCWSSEDLVRAQLHAAEIWSLDLNGPMFDDVLLEEMQPAFPAVEIIQLCQTRISGRGLFWLRNCPRLRVLNVYCGDTSSLDITGLPEAPRLTSLSIAGVRGRLLGVRDLASACTALQDLYLSLGQDISADGELHLHGLANLSLTAPRLPAWLKVRGLTTLHLHCAQATTAEVCAMLDRMTESLTSVDLSGTPVTDEVFMSLGRIANLGYVNLVDTEVTSAALTAFVRVRPQLKYHRQVGAG